MSISKGAFGQSAKGSFIESAMGARGWAAMGADIFAATVSTGGSNLYGLSFAGDRRWRYSISPVGAIAPGGLSVYGKMGMDDECVYLPMVSHTAWAGSGGALASVLAIYKSSGSVKWHYNTGSNVNFTCAIGDGTVIVGSGAFVYKLSSTGVLVWSYNLPRGMTDGVVNSVGDIIIVNAGAPATLTKISGDGVFIANNAASYPGTANQYAAIDTDETDVLYVTYADGGLGTHNIVCIGSAMANQLWTANSGGGRSNATAPRAINKVGQYVMVTNFVSGLRQVYGGTVGSAIDVGNQSGRQYGIDLSTEPGLFAYVGGTRTTSWLGSGGAIANLVKADVSVSAFPPSSTEWGLDLKDSSTQEEVVRVAAKKHWNAI